jgi:hypothetical protein
MLITDEMKKGRFGYHGYHRYHGDVPNQMFFVIFYDTSDSMIPVILPQGIIGIIKLPRYHRYHKTGTNLFSTFHTIPLKTCWLSQQKSRKLVGQQTPPCE